MKRAHGRGRRFWKIAIVLILLAGAGGAAALFLPDLLGGPGHKAKQAYRKGNWTEAETLARQILKTTPRDLEARRILARSLSRQKRDGESVPIFRSMTMDQMEVEDLSLIGQAMVRGGDRDLGQDALEAARKLDPNHVETIKQLLDLYETDDELTLALDFARKLASLPGQKAIGSVDLACLSEALDNPRDAFEAWTEAFASDPKLTSARVRPEEGRIRQARAALRIGKPDEAIKALKADTSPEASWLLSRAYLQKEDWKKAQTALNRSTGAASRARLTTEPSPYVGSERCAECHDAIYSAQSTSRHSKTFHLGTNLADLTFPLKSVPDPKAPGVVHTYNRQADGQVLVKTQAGKDTSYQTLINFAFGSGDRGLTFVGQDQDHYGRELRLSHYGEGDLWDLTFGQNPMPRDHTDLVGRSLTTDGIRRCVSCHVTHPGLGIDRSGPEAKDGAIGCERCHGPGGNHIKAVEAEFPDLAIAQPSTEVGPAIVGLCGNCHKPKGEVPRTMQAVVRFQAATLTWSKCFNESFGKLDCVTCHDPHRNANTAMTFYESRCLNCHGPQDPAKKADRPQREPDPKMKRVACKVNSKTGCIGCHMPSDTKAIEHSPFTNHEIKIHRDLPPASPATPHAAGRSD